MSLVRRIIIVLVGFSLAILVTVLLLNPESIQILAASISETSGLIRLPLAILVDMLVLAVLIVLVRSERASHETSGLIVKAQGAIADVSVESARDRILRAVRAVPDVLSAEAVIKAIHGKTDVDLEVVVSRESKNLPEKQKELDRALRQVINKELGLQMAGKPRVHIRMDDEKLIAKTAELPSPVIPVKTEPVIEPDVKPEPPLPIPVKDTMSLRSDPEEPSTPS